MSDLLSNGIEKFLRFKYGYCAMYSSLGNKRKRIVYCRLKRLKYIFNMICALSLWFLLIFSFYIGYKLCSFKIAPKEKNFLWSRSIKPHITSQQDWIANCPAVVGVVSISDSKSCVCFVSFYSVIRCFSLKWAKSYTQIKKISWILFAKVSLTHRNFYKDFITIYYNTDIYFDTWYINISVQKAKF